jgi:hypothetical protein
MFSSMEAFRVAVLLPDGGTRLEYCLLPLPTDPDDLGQSRREAGENGARSKEGGRKKRAWQAHKRRNSWRREKAGTFAELNAHIHDTKVGLAQPDTNGAHSSMQIRASTKVGSSVPTAWNRHAEGEVEAGPKSPRQST